MARPYTSFPIPMLSPQSQYTPNTRGLSAMVVLSINEHFQSFVVPLWVLVIQGWRHPYKGPSSYFPCILSAHVSYHSCFHLFPSFDNRLGGLIAASSGLCFPSPSPFSDLACYWRQSNKGWGWQLQVEYKVGICVKLKWLRLYMYAPHGDWDWRDIDMIDKSVSFCEDTLYTIMLSHPHVLFISVHAYLMLLIVSKFHLFFN